MKQQAIKIIAKELAPQTKELPSIHVGETVTVHYRIVEETKERIQMFKGIVIKMQGQGHTATFTVRKISDGVGVERIFPINSPFISKIEVNRKTKVRRAKLFFLRGRNEKKLKEKITFTKKKDSTSAQS